MYEKIKQLCKEKGISVRQLERNFELSNGSVCKWENSIPRADILQKLAEYFGVPITYFLEKKEEQK